MLIYNTTFLVNNKLSLIWMKWVEDVHIPFMRKTGKFMAPQIARVLFTEDKESTSYSVQFKIENIESLGVWSELYADHVQREIFDKFGKEVLPFSTVLEIIE